MGDLTESLFYLPLESLSSLLMVLCNTPPNSNVNELSEEETAQLTAFLESFGKGLAMALSNEIGKTVEIEMSSLALNSLAPPPVFALDESAIRVRLRIDIPDVLTCMAGVLLTPQTAEVLVAPKERLNTLSGEGGKGVGSGANASHAEANSPYLSEDSIASMLTELDGMNQPSKSNASSPFPTFSSSSSESALPNGVDLILDIALDVTVELGRVRMLIKDVLELAAGSIIELDRIAGEPVDVLVNGRLIAKGEVVVIEDNFGIRITEIISPTERAAGLGRRRA
jgi:flagellar motor switch protein FliN/FliY